MTQKYEQVDFWTPSLRGGRFDDCVLPLDVLKDFSALEGLVMEVARWHFMKENPTRSRVTRGFFDGVQLGITRINSGSTIPTIAMFLLSSTEQLFSLHNPTWFEKARESIIAAVHAAETGGTITDHLAPEQLIYFDRIGRSLRADESIEFGVGAKFTRETRKRLLAASSVSTVTEDVVLRGRVPTASQDKMTFELQLNDGRKVVGPIDPQHHVKLLDAFNGYHQGKRVAIKGIGRFDRSQRLKSIETVDLVTPLSQRDVGARIEELSALKDGWLEGKGLAPTKEALDWFESEFTSRYPVDLPLPYLFPTPDGGIDLEWTLGVADVSLEIDLGPHVATWHVLNLETQVSQIRESLDLNSDSDWRFVLEQIKLLDNAGE